MKRLKPILHARDHMPGGADPIPGLIPPGASGAWPDFIATVSDLIGWWRLGEGADPYMDTSPYADAHLSKVARTVPMNPDVAGGLPDAMDDGAVEFTGTATTDGDWLEPAVTGRFQLEGEPYTVVCWVKLNAAGAAGQNTLIVGTFQPGSFGWMVGAIWPAQTIFHGRTATGGSPSTFVVGPGVEAGEWIFVAATRDPSDGHQLFYNATLVDTDPGVTVVPGQALHLGAMAAGGGPTYGSFNGGVDEVAIFGRVLTTTEIEQLYASADPSAAEHPAGWVPVSDGEGGFTWQPPGTEIEHGGGEETGGGPGGGPIVIAGPGTGVLGTPTSAGGWSYVTHQETLVVYDSAPARFDVPSRTWVRVPFNTARCWRQWEATPAANLKQQWLPDDRGVTDQARDGVLMVTDDMAFEWDDTGVVGWPAADEQSLEGWFSIEYPVLDYTTLPMSDPPDPDAYNRVFRLFDLRRGRPVRTLGSSVRGMREWPFSHNAVDMEAGGGFSYTVDNPYPVYPVWAARPLYKPLPYTALSPTDSVRYYQTTAGNPGVGGLQRDLSRAVHVAAGDRYTLQAWQDTPWLLRFSTNHFPNYRGIESIPGVSTIPHWMNQPMLALTFYYDPETIDHSTGRLL